MNQIRVILAVFLFIYCIVNIGEFARYQKASKQQEKIIQLLEDQNKDLKKAKEQPAEEQN